MPSRCSEYVWFFKNQGICCILRKSPNQGQQFEKHPCVPISLAPCSVYLIQCLKLCVKEPSVFPVFFQVPKKKSRGTRMIYLAWAPSDLIDRAVRPAPKAWPRYHLCIKLLLTAPTLTSSSVLLVWTLFQCLPLLVKTRKRSVYLSPPVDTVLHVPGKEEGNGLPSYS